MSSDSAKPIIFLSYAHLDEPEKPRGEEIQWLTFVMKFLRPAVKSGEFRIWVDRQMQGGTNGTRRSRDTCSRATFSFCSFPPILWVPTTS